MNKSVLTLILIYFISVSFSNLKAQSFDASPSNWLYPDGNESATKYNKNKSFFQSLDSFVVKWSSEVISGDVQPLIGNIINNEKINSIFPYAPNEIAVVSGREIIILDGTGRYKSLVLDPGIAPIKGISLLFDSTATTIQSSVTKPVVMALETIEHSTHDSLGHSYIATYNNSVQKPELLKRLAIDMRKYPDNIYLSLKPVFGKSNLNNTQIFATADIYKPIVNDTANTEATYFRGFTQFNSAIELPTFPLPDIGDDFERRIEFAHRINQGQPTIANIGPGDIRMYMPSVSDTGMNVSILNNLGRTTNAERNYLTSFEISSNQIIEFLPPIDLSDSLLGIRPFTRPYFVNLNNGGQSPSPFLLLAEQYSGVDASIGKPRLHLLDLNGGAITTPNSLNNPSFRGDSNHFWSIAIGDIDGNSQNTWTPFYPNNPGIEILATQSSRNFSYPESKLFVFKYNSNDTIPKPTPPNTELFPFDTICSFRINGWLAAVNDLDNNPDEKEEIILVDGSRLIVLKMRDYQDFQFRSGRPFDTLFIHNFRNETITAVEIADLEGDGLNDIIVTTFRATYIIGTQLENVIQILNPTISMIPPDEYCVGDSIEIIWRNIIVGQGELDIYFESANMKLLLADSVKNIGDTVSLKIELTEELIGETGFFRLISSSGNEKIQDSSANISIKGFEFNNINLSSADLKVGETIAITGDADCFDSLIFEMKHLDYDWSQVGVYENSGDNSFSFDYIIPCLDELFECQTEDNDSLIYIRIISNKSVYSHIVDTLTLTIRPAEFEVFRADLNTVDPTQYFSWNVSGFDYDCGQISVLISYDGGISFSFLETINSMDEKFDWKVPLNNPGAALFRFCCENSCMRKDTLITDLQVNYIDIIAPNPFNPETEEAIFVYRVPESGLVKIQILDENNRIVKNIANGIYREEGIAHTDRWNGQIKQGEYAANGLYYLFIEFENGTREIHPIYVRR